MRNLFKNTPLSKEYLNFTIITVLIAFLICVWLGVNTYNLQHKERAFRYGQEADRISEEIDDLLDNVSYFAKFVGLKIRHHDTYDPTYIANLLKMNKPDMHSEEFSYTQTFLGWVTPDNLITINSIQGIVPEPINISYRTYLPKLQKMTWKLHPSDVDRGVTSHEEIVPLGYGITDKDGKYMGALTMGMPLNRFRKALEEAIASKDIEFVVLDKNYQILVQAYTNQEDIKDRAYFENFKHLITDQDHDMGYLKDPIVYDNVNYSFFRVDYRYPFIVLVGENALMANKEFRQTVLPRIVEAIVIMIFMLVLLFFFRKKVVMPMVKLAAFANEISKGNLKAKLPKVDSYEGFILARSLVLVKRSFDREQKLKKKLTEAKDSTLKISEAKTRLLRHVIHDVRSPLTSVSGMAEIISKEVFGEMKNKKYLEYANDIHKVVAHVIEVVNDLLDLEKIEYGNTHLKEQHVHVEAVLDQALVILHEQAEAKFISFSTEYELSNPIRLLTEEKQLLRMCLNVISNSIKYSDKGKEIIIRVIANEKQFDIIFIDQGFGMPHPEKALEPFNNVQTTANPSLDFAQSGLGLSLVKKMVETVHQGKLIITSNVGVGTTITFSFPQTRIIMPKHHKNDT